MFGQFDDEPFASPFFNPGESDGRIDAFDKKRDIFNRKLKDAHKDKDDDDADAPPPRPDSFAPENFLPEVFSDLSFGTILQDKYFSDMQSDAHKDQMLGSDRAKEALDRKDGLFDLVGPDKSDYRDRDSDKKKARGRDVRDGKKTYQPVYGDLGQAPDIIQDLPGDWVPDKLDPIDNGGFTLSPDNGSPVPYRLNGHVDMQRVRPWDINN